MVLREKPVLQAISLMDCCSRRAQLLMTLSVATSITLIRQFEAGPLREPSESTGHWRGRGGCQRYTGSAPGFEFNLASNKYPLGILRTFNFNVYAVSQIGGSAVFKACIRCINPHAIDFEIGH